MNRILGIAYFLIALPGLFGQACAQPVISLENDWWFRMEGSEKWMKARVPGEVHTDLMGAGQIPDPFIGTNEKRLRWIEEKSWYYRTHFFLHPDSLEQERELLFEGLDTYATIILNGEVLGQTDNSFVRWTFPLKDLLPGRNQLEVRFDPPAAHWRSRLRKDRYHLSAGNDDSGEKVSVYTRKPAFQFGWDWAPRLVGCGITGAVRIRKVGIGNLLDVRISSSDIHPSSATISCTARLDIRKSSWFYLEVLDKSGKVLARQEKKLQKGIRELALRFRIENPVKWWPHTLGNPHLYQYRVRLSAAGESLGEKTVCFGLRTVELIREPDSIGTSYYFKVNGQAVFLRGANFIPPDVFPTRVGRGKLRKLLVDCREAGFNAIRVWGGGGYGSDHLYDLCDSLGIMVWQDFPFACAMYPADKDFRKTLRREVRQQVRRLRNHPCLIHWCGNNEVEVAWKNWGWPSGFSLSSSEQRKWQKAYDALFHQLIPDILAKEDPNRPYTHTSPTSNWGQPENFLHGSMHYWGVWHGEDGFEGFRNQVGRFMSEYGFQAYPDMETIREFHPFGQPQAGDSILQNHQKSYVGTELVHRFLNRYFAPPTDLPDLVYKSQLTQALGLRTAIFAHRAAAGRCMGSLFWQLNDCWPGISWSVIDYYNRKKAAFYGLRDWFAPNLLVPGKDHITLVTDHLRPAQGEVRIFGLSYTGDTLSQEVYPVKKEAGRFTSVLAEDSKPPGPDSTSSFRILEWWSGDSLLCRAPQYLALPKNLELPVSEIGITFDPGTRTLTLHSPTLTRWVQLSAEGVSEWSDNYFDLLPGETRTIRFEGQLSGLSELSVRYLNPH